MRHPACLLAIALSLAGSAVEAAPAGRHRKVSKHDKKAKHHAKVAPPVEEDIEDEDDSDGERIAFAADDDDDTLERDEADDEEEAPVKRHKHAATPHKDWHLAIGPYLWASSVDANVSLGSTSVGTGIDFMQLQHHAKYGAEVLTEVRYRKLAITADFMYGVVGVNGAKDVGPLMVTLDGTASSLLIDGFAGYQLLGNDHSIVSLEARGGVRYQRTAIGGSLAIGGSPLVSKDSVNATGDALAGARVFVRPWQRFYVSSSVDAGVFGSSSATWSAAADASLAVSSRLLLSVGYRTLTMDGANLSIVMHGPRAALQLTF